MPVKRFELLIKRRKARQQLQLDWNPLLRRLDIPPCESTCTTDAARMVCDDRVHVVSPARMVHARQRTYCRAVTRTNARSAAESSAINSRP